MTRRSWGHAAVAALVVALGTLATREASAFEFGTPATTHPYKSAQDFALELRFSPYKPAIDKEPGLSGTPYNDRFGDNPRLLIGLELDWQMLRIPHLGTLGPGLGIGTVGMSRTAYTTETPPRLSGDEYSLDIYPFYLTSVLRADVLWRDFHIPFVPYAKLGLGYALWRSRNALGTSEVNGSKGKGGSYGTHMAVGVGLALDFIDEGASRNMDAAIGINNTYLYAEYYWLNLNDFGSGNALYVGTNTYALGLAFEF